MVSIIVNKDLYRNGKISVQETTDYSKRPIVVAIEGLLEVYRPVDDEITSVSCSRFELTGMKVHSKAYGSEESTIIYGFTAATLQTKTTGYEL